MNREAAHKILDYLLTKAAVSGKAGKSTFNIPYLELINKLTIEDLEHEDLDLQISIRMKWVEREFIIED